MVPTEIDSHVVSCIGDDEPGREILAWLQQLSINSDYIAIDPDHETDSVGVSLDNSGTATYTINEAVAWDFIPNTMIELARNCKVVCFGSLAQRNRVSRTSIHAFLDNTPNHVLRIFDINLRQYYYNKAVIEASLEKANILKINDEELLIIKDLLAIEGDNKTHQLQSICDTYQLRLSVLTRGAQGSQLVTPTTCHVHPGIPIDVVDTVGAGDAFTAVVAVGMLKQFDLGTINDYANQVAAFVCSKKGATPMLTDDLLTLFD